MKSALSLLSSAYLVFQLTGCASAPEAKKEEEVTPVVVPAKDEASFEKWTSDSQGLIEEALQNDTFHDHLDNEEEKSTSLSQEDFDEKALQTMLKRDANFNAVAERFRKRKGYAMPVEINRGVLKWIHFFTVRDRDRFERFLARGNSYRGMIESTLAEYGVPKELFYLAMIESGFQFHARSRARATGMWQFMQATGKLYGLKVTDEIDDRRDPIRATRAAAAHLKDLHEDFGSWYLALAAYNAGPRRVDRAVLKAKTRDFWKIVAAGVLPRETMNYVPKFLAAVIIGRNPNRFGFKNEAVEAVPDLKAIAVPAGAQLRDIALVSGVPLDDLKEANPHLKLGRAPYRLGKRYDVWVPEKHLVAMKKSEDLLAKLGGKRSIHVVMAHPERNVRKATKVSTRAKAQARKKVYRVRRGDNLHDIAKRFGVSIQAIMRVNQLQHSRIYPGMALKV